MGPGGLETVLGVGMGGGDRQPLRALGPEELGTGLEGSPTELLMCFLSLQESTNIHSALQFKGYSIFQGF